MTSSGHHWDRHGLKFVAKFGVLFIVLVTLAYFFPFGIFKITVAGQAGKTAELASESLRGLSEGRQLKLALDASRLLELAVQNQIRESAVIGEQSIKGSVPSQGKFVAFDLAAMKAYTYQHGEVLQSFEIMSKGRPGSHWETPAGLYEILLKEPEHFSSIGRVYMPYSMQFFGNYFIHGWPYYADGVPVREGFSGGCIRLSSEDAKSIYEFADKGTQIFVYDKPFDPEDTGMAKIKVRNINPPMLSAKSYIIADVNTGTIFLDHRSEEALPIASITKLMTALVANETISFDKVILVDDPSSVQEGDYGSVRAGDKFVVGDALYPLLMESNNAVAHSIARYYGQNSFIKWMNSKARALGMSGTSFADASGLSEKNISTARDLYFLARYLLNHKSFILNISKEPVKKITSETGRGYEFRNYSNFVGDDNFLGGKTGFTDSARETMLSVVEVPHASSTSTLAVIVLGSGDREGDTRSLLRWFNSAAVRED